jgi:ABC-type phosphate/phosphonate transport system permease subunit
MSATNETVRIAIFALLAGAALPLIIQLFLTARSFRRTVDTVERRLDRALRDIDELSADLRRRPAAGSTSIVGAIAAATPAVVAAVRAFRTSMHDQEAPGPTAAPPNNHDHDKNKDDKDKEKRS